MVDDYEQDTRLGEFLTVIGKEKLVLNSFTGEEGISEPFKFEVSVLSKTNNAVDFNPALGRSCSVRITSINGTDRFFTGILTEATALGPLNDGFLYTLVLRPWFWLLTKQTRSQVFHDMTVPEIVRKVFSDHGELAKFSDRLEAAGLYPQLEYCVQHDESDFNFVSRLLEASGIGYFFEYDDTKHVMVLADMGPAYPDAPGKSRLISNEDTGREEERLFEWWPSRHFATENFVRNDYDFRLPHANMVGTSSAGTTYSHANLENYRFPYRLQFGQYITTSEGNNDSYAAGNAEQVSDSRALAYGDCVTLSAGMRLKVYGYPDDFSSSQHLILRATHQFYGPSYRSGDGGSTDYTGSIETTDVMFYPPRVTPKPVISGPQTGQVVGNSEIDTDEFGRVRVHFHWMRDDGNTPEGQSMWCRVAQVWASATWGGQFIPRDGMEVLVQFIDGDPDRPVIVGTLYNGENQHPFTVPDDKDISGWRSHSVSGSPDNYNEISMKDTMGQELLTLHAERDLLTEVENDEKRQVDQNRTSSIGTNDTLNVGSDLTIEAGNKITLRVGSSQITMDRTSIKIEAMQIVIEASASLQASGGSLAELKSGGMLTITGGMVTIN